MQTINSIEQYLGEDNQIGIDIWNRKYRYNNESFTEWIDRVSNGDNELKRLILEKKFLFGGRILANRGLYKKGLKLTYSNCYVATPPTDNLESIFDTAKNIARTFSYGGGVGVDISNLAPRGAKVNNTAKETSGAISFMDLYSMVTGLIGQNGRRGALMISLDCNHPDIEEFIDIKSDLNKVTKANISIKMTDEFMQSVKNSQEYKLSFTRNETGETITKNIDARKLFNKLAKMNWDYAEPGILFWDKINEQNLLSEDETFEYAGVNPCAEEPLPAGGSCLLGSLNLSEFVREDKNFDIDGFEIAIEIAVKALNNVLDEGLPLHPLQEQKDSVKDWRQIGLGIMGLADCLIKMGYIYGSEESIELCDGIAKRLAMTAILSSAMLAEKYGCYNKCNINNLTSSQFYKDHSNSIIDKHVNEYGLRNSQLLTCAPTGTLSTMLGISGGIEPIFANYYIRKTESLHGKNVDYKVYTPIVKQYMEKNNITDDNNLPEYFITSHNLSYKQRIDMQSVWQKHIDASISSTVNLPNSTTIEDVENLYIYAWGQGLKGITVYRSGCKREGILTTSHDKEFENTYITGELKRGDIIEVNDDAIGKKRKLLTGCGSLHCVAFFDPINGELLETYFSKGSSGGCHNFMIGLSRIISLAVRSGCDIHAIIDQLNSCGSCPSYAVRRATKKDTSIGSCCPIAIGKALLDMYDETQYELGLNESDNVSELQDNNKNQNVCENPCPECGEELSYECGCNQCHFCGWSKCQ